MFIIIICYFDLLKHLLGFKCLFIFSYDKGKQLLLVGGCLSTFLYFF